jgi:hypothetical protein
MRPRRFRGVEEGRVLILEGFALRSVLRLQRDTVEVRGGRGDTRGYCSPAQALEICRSGDFIGVGTADGIRYIRPVSAPKGGILAEDNITSVGRDEVRQHHEQHCDTYRSKFAR